MKKSIYLKIIIIIIICTFLMWIVIKLSSSEEYSSVTENEQLPVTEQVINKDVIQIDEDEKNNDFSELTYTTGDINKQEDSVSINTCNKIEEYNQLFDKYDTQEITIADVSISYNGFIIYPNSNYWEIINSFGYPYDYEINNFGYISNENGYRWGLCYPSQNFVDYDIYIVCVAEDMIRESENTYIDFIILNSVSTNRGINVGDTIENVAEKYGKPTKIQEYSPNPDYNELVYENEYADLRFVFSRDDIVKYIIIDFKSL